MPPPREYAFAHESRRKARREHAPSQRSPWSRAAVYLGETVRLTEVERQRIDGVARLARDALAEGGGLFT